MKINAVNRLKTNYTTGTNSKYSTSPKNITQNSKNELYPISYQDILFGGKNRKTLDDIKKWNDLKKEFSQESEEVYEKAQKVAKKLGSNEVESWHLYLTTLIETKKYAQQLKKGERKHYAALPFKTPNEMENLFSQGYLPFADDEALDKIISTLDNHIKKVVSIYKKPNCNTTQRYSFQPKISKEAIRDLCSCYDFAYAEKDMDSFTDDCFYAVCDFSKDKKLMKLGSEFDYELQKSLMTADNKKAWENHLSFYDDKARNALKNIDFGSDVAIVYEDDNKQATKYFVASILNEIDNPDTKYRSIKKDKTEIIILNNKANIDFLKKLAKKSKENKEQETIVICNFDELMDNAAGACGAEEIKLIANENSSNFRIIFMMAATPYYTNSGKWGVFKDAFANNALQILPDMNMNDAKLSLSDKTGLEFINKMTKKTFGIPAIEKAIELTNSATGNFPDKALSLLNSAGKFFIDEENITPEHLEKYTDEVKEMNSNQTDEKEINIIYDTHKNLSDIVGTPATKAQAQAIVKQIKSGTIGTKGYVIYLDNGSNYGGGRRNTVEAIAGEAQIPMVEVNARDFALKDIDTLSISADFSELKIKNLISQAKAQAKTNKYNSVILFIENFDNIASDPLYGISSIYEQKAFSQLLLEMENARKNKNVNLIIIGSTNMPELLDSNIIKPYRFLNSIVVSQPNSVSERLDVLKYYIDKMDIKVAGDNEEEQEQTVKNLSQTISYFSVVDIIYLLETAKNVARERGKTKIDSSDFTEAYLQVLTGRISKAEQTDSEKKIVASHEAGHALALQIVYDIAKKDNIPWHLPNKVDFITLDQRGDFGGAVFEKDSENREISYQKMLSDVICSYGGHSAENEIYNINGSYGITSDMENAAHMARNAVLNMGMGKKTGVCHIPYNALGSADVSEEKRRMIEQDIDDILIKAKGISDSIIKAYKGFIIEFSEKYYSKVGSGECIISGDEFIRELNNWRNKQPKEKLEELSDLEVKIKDKMKN